MNADKWIRSYWLRKFDYENLISSVHFEEENSENKCANPFLLLPFRKDDFSIRLHNAKHGASTESFQHTRKMLKYSVIIFVSFVSQF